MGHYDDDDADDVNTTATVTNNNKTAELSQRRPRDAPNI